MPAQVNEEAVAVADGAAGLEAGPTAFPGSGITGIRETLKTLWGNSLVYFLAQAGVSGATMVVTPLYTHAMSPRAYGILAVAATVNMVVILLLSLQLDNAVGRLSVEAKSEEERRRLLGTILMFLLTVGLAMAVGLELLGRLGYLNIFRGVPYSPYLRYAVWAGYLGIFPFLPIAFYTVRGEPKKVLGIRYLGIAVQISMGVTLIVVLHEGAIGALRAILAGAAVSAIVSVGLIIRHASIRFSRSLLVASLAFCLPIIPHSVANWALSLSDRFVLQHYVNDTQLGLYQLGALVGGAASLLTTAGADALAPLFYWRLRDDQARSQVPPLGTYVLLVLSFGCVLLAVYGGTAIRILTPASYRGATVIVPWIACSFIFTAAYILLTYGTWYVMRTMQLAIGTLLAALLNIGATFLFGSLFGIVGAGISNLIGYAGLAVIQGLIAKELYPIPWEYRRWFKIFLVCGACLALCLLVGTSPTVLSIGLRAVVMVAGFPIGLQLLRFWTHDEQAEINRVLRAGLRAGARRVQSVLP